MNNCLYIFLESLLHGWTGCPSYVRNKKNWLESQGWVVKAFDICDESEKVKDDYYDELKEYRENSFVQLQYSPSWYGKSARINLIKKFLLKVGDINHFQTIVLESGTFTLALWGELFSKSLNAKHIIYLLGENVVIQTKDMYDFLVFKYIRNELFSITESASILLFSKFITLDKSSTRYWCSMSLTEPEEIDVPELQMLDSSEINICHFGRKKPYMDYMIKEIYSFAKKYNTKVISLVFWGSRRDDYLQDNLFEKVPQNVKLSFFPASFPIPKALFRLFPLIIATAGCANISFKEGALTVSMNVKTKRPLGVMGYTTRQSVYSSIEYPDSKDSLSVILEDIFIKDKYSSGFNFHYEYNHGYDYQIGFVNSNKYFYKDILHIKRLYTINKYIKYFLVRMGFLKFLANIEAYKISFIHKEK